MLATTDLDILEMFTENLPSQKLFRFYLRGEGKGGGVLAGHKKKYWKTRFKYTHFSVEHLKGNVSATKVSWISIGFSKSSLVVKDHA